MLAFRKGSLDKDGVIMPWYRIMGDANFASEREFPREEGMTTELNIRARDREEALACLEDFKRVMGWRPIGVLEKLGWWSGLCVGYGAPTVYVWNVMLKSDWHESEKSATREGLLATPPQIQEYKGPFEGKEWSGM